MLALAVVCAAMLGSAQASGGDGSRVVVPRGKPVEIAFTAVKVQEIPGVDVVAISASIENAIRLAVELRPRISGFPIQINVYDTSCVNDNSASAAAIVANAQNTAVLGDLCSQGAQSALPVYEQAGLPALSGTATADTLPALGPTVFARTAVADGDDGTAWYETVKTLPSDQLWRHFYQHRFGVAPTDFADLYFDATNLLLTRLQQASRFVHGNLVVDRVELARAIRGTKFFPGVTCFITLDPSTGNRLNSPAVLRLCGA
jgi:ABC-type branched-subunit amino acid transport system substrate-binding protein